MCGQHIPQVWAPILLAFFDGELPPELHDRAEQEALEVGHSAGHSAAEGAGLLSALSTTDPLADLRRQVLFARGLDTRERELRM